MTEYDLEEVEPLASDTGTNAIEYEDVVFLIDFNPEDFTDKLKLRLYSDYLRSEYYREHEDRETDETILTNLLYVWPNETEGIYEYDIVTKDLDVLHTNWIYMTQKNEIV